MPSATTDYKNRRLRRELVALPLNGTNKEYPQSASVMQKNRRKLGSLNLCFSFNRQKSGQVTQRAALEKLLLVQF